MTTVKWDPDDDSSTVRNSSCISEANEFEDRRIFDEDIVSGPDRLYSSVCDWTVDGTDFGEGELRQVAGEQNESCPYPVVDAWCINIDGFHCAIVYEVAYGCCMSRVQGADPSSGQCLWRGDEILMSEPHQAVYLRPWL